MHTVLGTEHVLLHLLSSLVSVNNQQWIGDFTLTQNKTFDKLSTMVIDIISCMHV